MTLTTYNTTFTEQNGSSNELIDLKIEYGADFTGDQFDDIKITLALDPTSQSGTEDIVGLAFDIQNDAVSDLKIVEPITTALTPGATSSLSLTPVLKGIAANNVGDRYLYDFDLSTNGGNALPPYDVGVQLNNQGLGDGQVQSTTFVLTSLSGANSLDAEQLLENTDWWIRLQSTNSGGSSAKTGGHLGDIPTPGTFTPAPAIAINKVTNGVDNLQVLAGSDVTWTYTVTNPGNVPLSNVSLTDDQQGQITNLTDGDDGNQILDPGETWVYTATGIAGIGDYSNTGTVAGDYNGTPVTAQDPSNYFGANPQIQINKVTTANTATGVLTGDNLQNVLLGSPITWTYTVTNTGNVALSGVNVDDNKLESANDPVFNSELSGNGDKIFDAGEVWKYTATGTAIPGNYSNIGTVTGGFTDSLGNTTPVSGADGSGYSSEKGLGKTPGFWKQSQHFQYWPVPYKTTDKFSTTFGVSTTSATTFKYGGYDWFNDSLLGALSAEDLKGSTGSNAVKLNGNVSALGRSATAALLNATSDELNNNVKGSNINYIIDPTLLLPEVVTFLSTKVDGIFDANLGKTVGGDSIISSLEVINAVKDVFTLGGGLYGASDVNSLAKAFDAMNNMAGG
ncbi:DUF7507 domain-containing protein [Planktothrix paucivesiculata]|uniref:DUF7507 domain-containing protein n=1 Tax=Planktothrix paucivesiculata PCC 9631 TaxID=671071 RepID=A0A7Z9DUG2_9CYAN|nr:hypothetical protein [Planktothrix paucivesiculata]VXD10972.1 hypothetical protein PL9631_1020031 [Planktothrix paucivesiculata PCC 9631]